jgi:hypothetical protein
MSVYGCRGNKRSGYAGSIESISKLQSDIDAQLKILDSNIVNRWIRRTGEKMITAAAAVYLR